MRTVPRLLLSLALVAATALLAACETAPPDGRVVHADVEGGIPVYHVTKERHGQTVHLTKGQTLAVVLPNKVGSARRWTSEGVDPAVLARSSGTQTIGPRTAGGMIGGAAGHEKVHFQAVGAGSTPLRMTLQKNPRQGGGRIVFEIQVVVGGPAAR
jgi:hypothetical protein